MALVQPLLQLCSPRQQEVLHEWKKGTKYVNCLAGAAANQMNCVKAGNSTMKGTNLKWYGDHRRSKPEESVEEHRCQPDHQPVHDAVDEMAQWRSAGLTPLLCADQG